MPSGEIEEFAKLLMREVRDQAIRGNDALLEPHARSPVAMRWRQAGSPDVVKTVIPDVVDEVLFRLLNAIDQGALRLKFVSSSGKDVDLTEEGLSELAGWYMGSDGWREAYSEERFVDDLADLAE